MYHINLTGFNFPARRRTIPGVLENFSRVMIKNYVQIPDGFSEIAEMGTGFSQLN